MTDDTLPGMEHPHHHHGVGVLEQALNVQIDKLTELHYLEPHHAGLVALARVTAQDIDRSQGRGAPSGRANLLRVMREIFEIMPQPEQASKDSLDQVLGMLRDTPAQDGLHPSYMPQ